MTSPNPLPLVTVRASVQRTTLPDSFVLNARVSAHGNEATKATTMLVARYAQLEAAVAHLPPSVDIGHGPLTNWSNGAKRAEWSAQRTMSVTGTGLDGVGQVANAIAAVPDVALDGPHWQLDRDAAVHAELQADAVHEARARAERYATALGGTLGRLVELRDDGGQHYVMAASMSFRGKAEPDIASLDLTPQPLEIEATVTATWQLVLPG